MRFRLRTLLIIAMLAPPLIAGLLMYGERGWNEVRRWWIRQQPPVKQKVVPPGAGPKALPTDAAD
jgi:hypothetical protein